MAWECLKRDGGLQSCGERLLPAWASMSPQFSVDERTRQDIYNLPVFQGVCYALVGRPPLTQMFGAP